MVNKYEKCNDMLKHSERKIWKCKWNVQLQFHPCGMINVKLKDINDNSSDSSGFNTKTDMEHIDTK